MTLSSSLSLPSLAGIYLNISSACLRQKGVSSYYRYRRLQTKGGVLVLSVFEQSLKAETKADYYLFYLLDFDGAQVPIVFIRVLILESELNCHLFVERAPGYSLLGGIIVEM